MRERPHVIEVAIVFTIIGALSCVLLLSSCTFTKGPCTVTKEVKLVFACEQGGHVIHSDAFQP